MRYQLVRWAAIALVFLAILQSTFHLTLQHYISGLALGSLYGVIGVGIILIYRSLRIINFATAALGAVPAILAMMLDIKGWLNYWEALPVVLVGGLLFGAAADFVVMRRFATTSRLIATVITIGIAQSLAILAFFIPIWMGQRAGSVSYVPTPWQAWKVFDHQGRPILSGNQVFALASVLLVSFAVWAFLRYTRIGIALRAASENSDRAGLLGIPVRNVQTVAWMLAGMLSGLAIYAQAPLIGVPRDATLGFDTLLYGLAAAVVAGMDGIWIALGAGMAIGLIIFGSIYLYGDNNVATALMLVLILGALLARRGSLARAFGTGVATWREVKQFRKVPSQLAGLVEVIALRWTVVAIAVAFAIGLPFVVARPDMGLLTLLPLYGIVAVSLVVLTGWAGQISLGQFGIVGLAAGVAGGLVANHNIDFWAAMAIGVATGVIAAVVIGLPALRIQGLYLAVTTLAFGYAVQDYALNINYPLGRLIMPTGYTAHLLRPLLFGVVDLEDDRTFYFICIAFLFLCLLAAASFRRFRSGRVLMAARDNQRAAQTYGINVTGARLFSFAVSGAIAGVAGVLFAYQQHNVIADSYSVPASITLFLATVIGGLGSLPAAALGAMTLEAFVAFFPRLYQLLGDTWAAVLPLLVTGPFLIIQMMLSPGGLAESIFKARDSFLRAVANRRGILVPSLIADRRVAEPAADFKETLAGATEDLHDHLAQPVAAGERS